MSQIFEFRLGITGLIDLLGTIENGDQISFLDSGAVGDQFGKSHGTALTPDLWYEDF